MYIVALTGGIASGKSTVRQHFHELGIQSICADEEAKNAVIRGSLVLKQITTKFGKGILNKDANLDRAQLKSIIFNNKKAKLWLEELLHPIIRENMRQKAYLVTSKYCLVDIPLLTPESIKNYPYIQKIIVVNIDKQKQITRLCQRDNIKRTEAENIIKNQISTKTRLSLADFIIINNGNLNDLKQQVKSIHRTILTII